MSGYYNDYSENLDGDGRQEESGKGLRAQLEQALEKLNAVQGELAEFKAGNRQKSVTELLESKGIDPAVAGLIPQDADANEWLSQYGHLVGATKPLDAEETRELPTPEEDETTDPDLLAEQEAWEAANGLRSSGTTTPVTDPIEKLQSFKTEQELLSFIQSQGGVGGAF